MAYKQKGCSPITAKIKRTTKAGMVIPPMLNVGSPAKKGSCGSSPFKVTPPTNAAADFAAKLKEQQDLKNKREAEKTAQRKQKGADSYNKKLEAYRSNVLSTGKDMPKFTNPKQMDSYMRQSSKKAGDIAKFEKNLYDYDSKKNPSLTEGYTAKEYAMAKATGTYKSRAKNTQKNTPPATPKPAPKKPSSKGKSKVTGAIGSDLRRKQYDALGWAYDDTIKKPTKKKVEPVKGTKKPSAKTTKLKGSIDIVSLPTVAENKAAKRKKNKAARKAKAVDRKLSKAAAARAAGDIKKAERKEKRAAKKMERVARRSRRNG